MRLIAARAGFAAGGGKEGEALLRAGQACAQRVIGRRQEIAQAEDVAMDADRRGGRHGFAAKLHEPARDAAAAMDGDRITAQTDDLGRQDFGNLRLPGLGLLRRLDRNKIGIETLIAHLRLAAGHHIDGDETRRDAQQQEGRETEGYHGESRRAFCSGGLRARGRRLRGLSGGGFTGGRRLRFAACRLLARRDHRLVGIDRARLDHGLVGVCPVVPVHAGTSSPFPAAKAIMPARLRRSSLGRGFRRVE